VKMFLSFACGDEWATHECTGAMLLMDNTYHKCYCPCHDDDHLSELAVRDLVGRWHFFIKRLDA
jgi:hypothetical protein